MKKHFYLIFAILFLLIASFGITHETASAERKNSEDYFVLKDGQLQSTEEIIGIVFQNSVDLVVDKNKVSSQLVENFNHDNCVGTSSYKFDGSRDPGNGNIKGTFVITIKGTCPVITPKPFSFKLDGTVDGFAIFTRDQNDKTIGTAKGQITNTATTVTFIVDGVVTPMSSEIGKIIIDFPGIDIEGLIDDSGARFSSMTGQVEWRADDDPNGWKLCKLGTKLPVNAHIRTQEDSSAILSFSDMSIFIMKAETEIIITSPPEKDGKIKLAAGKIWMNIKKIVKDGSMEVDTNQAVCGIKGTTLTLEELNGVSTLKVIEGKVLFTPKVGGGETMVEGGSSITATAQGVGTLEKFDAEKESKDWETLRAGGESVEKPVSDTKSTPALTGDSNKIIYFVIIGGVILTAVILVFIFKRKK